MPKRARDVEASLCRKGFRQSNGDHAFFYLFVDGKKTGVKTKISHGEKEIGDNLLATMAKQVHLTKSRFKDLIECPLSEDDYVALLRESGKVARAPV